MLLEARRLRGVCAASLTPIGADLEPDADATIHWIGSLFDRGCDGITLLGTTGEAASFSVDQRRTLMERVAASRFPLERIFVGTGASALADAVRLTRVAVDRGFAGALVIPPFYYKNLTDDAVVDFYSTLVEQVNRSELRLYLYHFPALSGVAFSLDAIFRLVERFPDTIVGLKDSSGTPGFAEAVAAAFPSIDVFTSSEAALRSARELGFAGCISASVNITASLASRVWNANGDDVWAERAQLRLADVRAALAGAALIPALRATVARRYADDRWLQPVPPLVCLNPEQRDALAARLDTLPGFVEIMETWP